MAAGRRRPVLPIRRVTRSEFQRRAGRFLRCSADA